MAEIHGIFAFFSNVSIAYRGGGCNGWQDGVGDGKIPWLGHQS